MRYSVPSIEHCLRFQGVVRTMVGLESKVWSRLNWVFKKIKGPNTFYSPFLLLLLILLLLLLLPEIATDWTRFILGVKEGLSTGEGEVRTRMEREVTGGDKVTETSIRRYNNYPVPILERMSSEWFWFWSRDIPLAWNIFWSEEDWLRF